MSSAIEITPISPESQITIDAALAEIQIQKDMAARTGNHMAFATLLKAEWMLRGTL